MEFIIELIREAAVRLPSYIGQVIGIVGGLGHRPGRGLRRHRQQRDDHHRRA